MNLDKQEEVVKEEPEVEDTEDEDVTIPEIPEIEEDYKVRAFIVVDMVKGFLEKQTKAGPCAMYVEGAKSIIPNIKREVDKLTGDDILIYVCDAHAEDDPEFKLYKKHCVEATEESEVVDDLPVDETESGLQTYRFNKTSFSGFRGTDLGAMLRCFEVEEVIIVGVVTEVCVFATAQDAASSGCPTTIIKDCIFPFDKAKGEVALDMLVKNYGVKLV